MRPTSSKSLQLTLVLLLLILLPACGAAPTQASTTAPTAEPTQAGPTDTPEPTATLWPSQTPLPSATPTLTPTLPPTAVPSLTPDPALAEIKLRGLAWLERYNMLLSFDFPAPVDPKDYRVMLEDVEFRCEVLAEYPKRLYCYGWGSKVLAVADVRVYPAGSDQPGFEKEVWVPYFK